MDRVLQDLRHAARSLRRTPGFAAVAILTMALGIGAVTAIFTVVQRVVLEPLPYDQPERLVHIEHPVPGENPDWKWGMTEAGYFYLREHNRAFEDIAVYEARNMSLAGQGTAEQVNTAFVSGNLFSVLRARPALGRLLTTDDNAAEGAPLSVAVLGYEFWRTRLGADPSIVGRTIRIEGAPVEVVGVTEPGFHRPEGEAEVWLPVAIDPANPPVNWHRFQAVGRLGEGVTPAAAEADLERLKAQFPEALPQIYYPGFIGRTQFAVEVDRLRDQVVGGTARVLWILLAAVGIVLLIACANVANLFLVRMEARRREMSVRTALGAAGRDLASRYLAESVLLALAAGALALPLAWGGIQLLLAIAPNDIPRLSEIGIGGKGAAFTIAIALATGLIFGALPLVRTMSDLSALREGGRGTTASRRRHAVRRALVVSEVALALVLLASAGLLLRTFDNLRSVDPGIDPDGVLTLDVSLPFMTYRDEASVSGFYRELTEQVARLPGVLAVGATTALPLRSGAGCALVFTDDPEAEARNDRCFAHPVRVTPGYFEAMGIPIRGRVPTWDDMDERRGEAVVSRAVADYLWPNANPIGRGIRGNGSNPPFYTIVGVADHVRAVGLDQPPVQRVYFPMRAIEGASLWGSPLGMTLAIKTGLSDPETLTPAIRRIVQEMDPTAPIGSVQTMGEVIAASTASTSFPLLLIGIAAAVALLLGMIGLYGVIAYVVEQQRRDIGIRMALGAPAGQVRGMIVRHSLVLVAVGLAAGLAAALWITRVLESMLFEVDPTDPITLLAVCMVLVAVALLASWVPARRATRIDPMIALRAE